MQKKKTQESHSPRIGKYACAVKRSSTGLGLFAQEDIPKGKFIVEYYGPVLTPKEADDKQGKYLFEVSSRRVVDGTLRCNTARYINHSCAPNCKVDIVKGKIYVYAKRRIRSGEEFAYNYGKEYFDDFIRPHGCQCIKCMRK